MQSVNISSAKAHFKPVKNFNRLGLLKNQIVLADDFDEWPEDIAVKFGIKD